MPPKIVKTSGGKPSTALASKKAKKKSPKLIANKKPSIHQLIIKIKSSLAVLTKSTFERPSFSTAKEKAARLEAGLATADDWMKVNLSVKDLAAPHRAPYSKIRDLILNGSTGDVDKLCSSLVMASVHCENAFKTIKDPTVKDKYIELAGLYSSTRNEVENAYKEYKEASLNPIKKAISKLQLIKALNNLASNAPGLGPHSTTNAIVSDRLHLHPTDLTAEPMTPRSRGAALAFPSEPIATTLSLKPDRQVVSVTGAEHSLAAIGTHTFEDVKVGTNIFRGALFVDMSGRVFKPKNPYSAPSGNFGNDWEQVT